MKPPYIIPGRTPDPVPRPDRAIAASFVLSVIANVIAFVGVVSTFAVASHVIELKRSRGYPGVAPLGFILPMGLWIISLALAVVAMVLRASSHTGKEGKRRLMRWLIAWLVQTVIIMTVSGLAS